MEQQTLRMPLVSSLQVERWAPTFVAALAAAAWWWFEGEISEHYAKELLAALLSAAAIAAGFLTTALSILLPIASSDTGRKLGASGYRRDLFAYFRSAIYGCLSLAALCVVAFFTLTKDAGPPTYLAALIIFFSAFSATSLIRITDILMSLFERASEPADKQG